MHQLDRIYDLLSFVLSAYFFPVIRSTYVGVSAMPVFFLMIGDLTLALPLSCCAGGSVRGSIESSRKSVGVLLHADRQGSAKRRLRSWCINLISVSSVIA